MRANYAERCQTVKVSTEERFVIYRSIFGGHCYMLEQRASLVSIKRWGFARLHLCDTFWLFSDAIQRLTMPSILSFDLQALKSSREGKFFNFKAYQGTSDIYIHTLVDVHMHFMTYIYRCIFTLSPYMRASCGNVCVHTFTRICNLACMYVRVYMFEFVFVHACLHTSIACVHTHVHTDMYE